MEELDYSALEDVLIQSNRCPPEEPQEPKLISSLLPVVFQEEERLETIKIFAISVGIVLALVSLATMSSEFRLKMASSPQIRIFVPIAAFTAFAVLSFLVFNPKLSPNALTISMGLSAVVLLALVSAAISTIFPQYVIIQGLSLMCVGGMFSLIPFDFKASVRLRFTLFFDFLVLMLFALYSVFISHFLLRQVVGILILAVYCAFYLVETKVILLEAASPDSRISTSLNLFILNLAIFLLVLFSSLLWSN